MLEINYTLNIMILSSIKLIKKKIYKIYKYMIFTLKTKI